MKPKRVLHVLGALNMGGAETMVMNLYRKIDRTVLQFDFVIHTDRKCDYTDEILGLGGKIYSVPRYKGTNTLQYIQAWKRFFKEHSEYKIIHAHMRSTASIYLSIAKKYGLTTIAHSHSISSERRLTGFIKNIYQLPLRYIADYYFACSVSAGKWLFGNKVVNGDRFRVIKNAIDAKKYIFNDDKRIQMRKVLNIDDKFVIGHIGRFHESKNHEFLIDLFHEIHNKYSNSVLVLVGEGDLKDKIIKKVQGMGLDQRVYFLGARNDIPDLLQAMDIFLFPSLYEGLGMVAIEAEASGLPVICSDNVPLDVKLTDDVYFVPLSEQQRWLEYINWYRGFTNRNNTYENIKNAGYDICTTAKEITEFYCMRQGNK